MKKKLLVTFFSLLLSTSFINSTYSKASAYELTSFSTIRDIEISEEEKAADIINFNEFVRIYFHNYISKKSEKEKNKLLVKLNSSINALKYSANTIERQPPVIMHWTDSENAMGVVRTLFQEHKSMKEGIIGVDYVVTEPLYHPDYPNRKPRAYSIKLSRSEVATTWYHVPDNLKDKLPQEDRKYNKAINIEIVGWRFFKNEKGRKNDISKNGKIGIREDFNGDFQQFDKFDEDYAIYPTVLKLVNHLAEKNNFASLIDNFSPEQEIDPKLQEKGITYLNGPLSGYLKGHSLVGWEHSLKYGGRYNEMRFDFTPKELLVFYQDLKDFRNFNTEVELVKNLEDFINTTEILSEYEIERVKDKVANIKSLIKKDYLSSALYVNSLKIDNFNKFNDTRRIVDSLPAKYRDKITVNLLNKFIADTNSLDEVEYAATKNVIASLNNESLRVLLYESLSDRYAALRKVNTDS